MPAVTEVIITSLSDESPLFELGAGGGGAWCTDDVTEEGDVSDRGTLLVRGGGCGPGGWACPWGTVINGPAG